LTDDGQIAFDVAVERGQSEVSEKRFPDALAWASKSPVCPMARFGFRSEALTDVGLIGRTSTPPNFAGQRLAISRAVSVVAGLDQVVAAEDFGRLHERPLANRVAADRGGGRGWLQCAAAEDLAAARGDVLGEALTRLANLLLRVGRVGRVRRLGVVDEDQVLAHRRLWVDDRFAADTGGP
jgi:hypothetical protein